MTPEELRTKIDEFLEEQHGYEDNTGWIEMPADDLAETLVEFILGLSPKP
jgi:hypothetical protein